MIFRCNWFPLLAFHPLVCGSGCSIWFQVPGSERRPTPPGTASLRSRTPCCACVKRRAVAWPPPSSRAECGPSAVAVFAVFRSGGPLFPAPVWGFLETVSAVVGVGETREGHDVFAAEAKRSGPSLLGDFGGFGDFVRPTEQGDLRFCRSESHLYFEVLLSQVEE